MESTWVVLLFIVVNCFLTICCASVFLLLLYWGWLQIYGWQFCRAEKKSLLRTLQGHLDRLSSEDLSAVWNYFLSKLMRFCAKLVLKSISSCLTSKLNIMVGHIVQNFIQNLLSFMKYAHLIYDIFSKEVVFSNLTCWYLKGWILLPWAMVMLS